MRKKLLSVLLIFAMTLSLIPATVWAAEGDEEPSKYVATVGGTPYESLQAAINNAGQSGGTVTLLKNYETAENIKISGDHAIILDLGLNTLTFREGGSLVIEAGATIQNGFIEQAEDGTASSVVQIEGIGSNLTVGNGCRITGQKCGIYLSYFGVLTVAGGMIKGMSGAGVVVRDGTLTVKGGSIEAPGSGTVTFGEPDESVEIPAAGIAIDRDKDSNSRPIYVVIFGGTISAKSDVYGAVSYTEKGTPVNADTFGEGVNISITGGAFSSDLRKSRLPFIQDPWTIVDNGRGLYFVVDQIGVPEENKAMVTSNSGNCYYNTFEAAVEAAQSGLGSTVTLLGNVLPPENGLFITVNADLTIELADYFLNLGGGCITVISATLTVNNTDGKTDQEVFSTGAQTVVVRDSDKPQPGKLVVGKYVAITNYGSSDATILVEDKAAVSIEGGKVSGEGVGVKISEGGALTVGAAGAVESAKSCAVYQPKGGAVNINDGTISGQAGIVTQAGEINVAGGTIIANGDSKSNITIDGLKVYPAGIVYCESSGRTNISIRGGEVSSKSEYAIVYYDENGKIIQSPPNKAPYDIISIATGSIFSSDVSGFLDAQHMVVKRDSKFYVTDLGEAVVVGADGSLTAYPTLQEAIEAINKGEGKSVVLANDIDDADSITISKDIDLELGGYSINFKAGQSLELKANVTITDGAITQAAGEDASSPVKVSGGTVTIYNAVITGGTNGIEIINGELTVKDGAKITGDENGILISGGTVTIGEENGDNSKIEVSGPTALYFKGGSGKIYSGTFQSTIKDGVSVKVDGSNGLKEFIYGGTFHNNAGGKDPIPAEYLAEDTIQHEDGTVEYLPGKVVTINFDPNGGSFAAGVSKTAKIIKGEKVGKTVDELPAPTRKGYRFAGWYTGQTNGTQVTTETIFKDEDITSSTVTVYAHWVTTYTVTFDANGGEFKSNSGAANEKETVQVDAGSALSKSQWPKAPTREGYSFDNWYTAREGGSSIGDTYAIAKDTTVYAHWKKTAPYEIIFDANGGKFSDGNSLRMSKTDKNGKLSGDDLSKVPTRGGGYQFDNWYTKDGALVNANTVFTDKDITDGAITVYAHWLKTHTVTFDANGGQFKSNDGSVKIKETAQVAEGSTLSKNQWPDAPTREGYSFDAWYTKPDGGGKVDDTYKFEKDTTVYAHWRKAAPYEITFDANGGKFAGGKKPVLTTNINGRLSQEDLDTVPIPTRAGCTFGGWYTMAEGGTKVTATTLFREDTTVYAHWIHTVTFDPNGGSFNGDVTPRKEATDDKGIVSKWPANPTRDGYSFDAWYTAKKGGTKVDSTYRFTRDTTVYALWTKTVIKEVTVTFDANGGTVSPSSATTTGGKLAKLPTPTRDGYTFVAWYTAVKGGTRISTETVFTEDTTIYAHWKKKASDGPDDPDDPDDPKTKKYKIQIDSDIRHGKVYTDPHLTYAEEGTEVWLTVKPDTDYTVDWVEVKPVTGSSFQLSPSGGQCSFKMPSSDVTIDAKFTLLAEYNTFIPPQTRPQSQASGQTSLPASAFRPITWRPVVTMWDVPAGSWAYQAARWAYQNGYLDLAVDGTFRLNDTVSHIQLWRIMSWWLGETALDDNSVIQWARKSGAVRIGAPSSAMTRQNMVEYLYQCYFLMGGDVSVSGNLLQYHDSQQITAESTKNAWLWAVNKGIISGTPGGYLNPSGVLSRGEFASILMRLCQNG